MPFQTVKLNPGINIEQSPTLNTANFAQSNLVRFYNGLIQKIGGWASMSQQTFIGICRGLHGWADIVGRPYLAVGTDQRLEVLSGGSLFDITPIVATDQPAPALTAVSGSQVVTVADASHSPNANDWVNFNVQVSVGGTIVQGYLQVQQVADGSHYTVLGSVPATSSVVAGGTVPVFTTTSGSSAVSVNFPNHSFSVGSLFAVNVSTAVGGLTLLGNYPVGSVSDANNFVIDAASGTATGSASAAMNGGNLDIQYLLPSGLAVNTSSSGYGIGDYGEGPYGIGSSGTFVAQLRQWSLDHWGEDLIASPSGGGIYYWQPPDITPAIKVSDTAPIYNNAVFVMPQIQIIIALGAEIDGTQQPLLVRWCDQGDFTDWTPSAINQAGSFTISSGSTLVGGLATGLGALIWTDQDMWSMSYIGFPLVFGFNIVATSCGLIAQRARGVVGSLVMWLSTRGFYTFTSGGGVTPIECPVWDFLFNNLDSGQLAQIHCATNSLFNEFAWHFPLATTSPFWSPSTPLAYVKFNFVEGAWDYGISPQYQRTAWTSLSPVGNPVGADTVGLLQQHEVSTDADGAAMIGGWQTGYFSIGDAEAYTFIDQIIPDFVTTSSKSPPVITLSLVATDFPYVGTTYTTGPLPVIAGQTAFVPCNIRARQIALSATWADLGTFNRIGAVRFRGAPDGRR